MKNKIIDREIINHVYHYKVSVKTDDGYLYNERYPLSEIVNFPECPLKLPQQLQSRIDGMKNGTSTFNNFWEAITTPKVNRGVKRARKKEVIAERFVNDFDLWPAGSVAHTIR